MTLLQKKFPVQANSYLSEHWIHLHMTTTPGSVSDAAENMQKRCKPATSMMGGGGYTYKELPPQVQRGGNAEQCRQAPSRSRVMAWRILKSCRYSTTYLHTCISALEMISPPYKVEDDCFALHQLCLFLNDQSTWCTGDLYPNPCVKTLSLPLSSQKTPWLTSYRAYRRGRQRAILSLQAVLFNAVVQIPSCGSILELVGGNSEGEVTSSSTFV